MKRLTILCTKKTICISVLLAAGGIAGIFFLTPHGAASVKAAQFLASFAKEFDVDIPRLPFVKNRAIDVRGVTIPQESGELAADLYRPLAFSEKVPGVVFSYGTVFSVKDPRIVKLSTALAQSGIAVLVPHFPDLLGDRVHERTARQMADAFLFLGNQDFVDARAVGFIGFCVGGSLALIAAADPAISQKVAFVHVISPYADLASFAASVFANAYETEAGIVAWHPSPQTLSVFQQELLELLSDREQRILEQALVTRYLSDDAQETLSPDAQRLWKLFRGGMLQDMRELLQGLSDEFQETARLRSPKTYVSGVSAPVFIATGFDAFIPPTESAALAQAFGKQARFARFSFLEHVDPTGDLPLRKRVWEAFRLWIHLEELFVAIVSQTS